MTDYLLRVHRAVHTATVEQLWMYGERLSYAWKARTDTGKPSIGSDDARHQVSFAATVITPDAPAASASVHRVSAVLHQLGDERGITIIDGFAAEVRPVAATNPDNSAGT